MQKAMMGGTSRTLLSISLLSSSTKHFCHYPFIKLAKPSRILPGFKTFCTATTTPIPTDIEPDEFRHSMLLERLRLRHLKESNKAPSPSRPREKLAAFDKESETSDKGKGKKKGMVDSFEKLGLNEEVMGAVREMGIEVPTEIQCIGIPSVLEEKSVVLGSHTGSGKTLAYMLPIVQVFFLSFFWNNLFISMFFFFFCSGALILLLFFSCVW